MTVGDWVGLASERLARAGVESPRLDAQLLAAEAAGYDRSWVMTHSSDEAGGWMEAAEGLLRRRESREPLAYILGRREFYGREFVVRPGVLVPRPETEILVERVLLAVGRDRGWDGGILDVGTGSGCLGLTLALELPESLVTLLDVSGEALSVAEENAGRLGVEVDIVESDLFAEVEGLEFDFVVSNPPYVGRGDELPPEVRDFEPELALYAQAGGLGFYRRLAAEGARMVTAGAMVVEIGMGQEEDVAAIFGEHGWGLVDAVRDLSGVVRVLTFGGTG